MDFLSHKRLSIDAQSELLFRMMVPCWPSQADARQCFLPSGESAEWKVRSILLIITDTDSIHSISISKEFFVLRALIVPTRSNTLPSVCTGVSRVSACALSTPKPPRATLPYTPVTSHRQGGKEGELSSVIPATQLLLCLHASHSSLSADLTSARPSVFLRPSPARPAARHHAPPPQLLLPLSQPAACPTGSLSGNPEVDSISRFVYCYGRCRLLGTVCVSLSLALCLALRVWVVCALPRCT